MSTFSTCVEKAVEALDKGSALCFGKPPAGYPFGCRSRVDVAEWPHWRL